MQKKILVASFQSLTKDSAGGIGKLAYALSAALHGKGILQSFIVSSKGKFNTHFPSLPVHSLSRYYLYILNKIKLKPYISRYIQEVLYDRFCAMRLRRDTAALVATTPYLFHTFSKAQKWNIPIFFIPGNPEDNYIYKIVSEENERYGIKEIDAYTYKKRLDYYNRSIVLVDTILIYSSLMEDTYRKAGYSNRIIAVYGYLKQSINNVVIEKQEGKVFKVSFLAYSVLLKGLQYLLEAWKDLQHIPDIELHIGGDIDENVQNIIDKDFSELKNVFYHGKISDVPGFFADKSIYILTSLIDGAPVTILEAMRSGLAVICTENCGTKDILEEGKSGWVIPIRNEEAIKSQIVTAYSNRENTRQMGIYAKSVIDHYNMTEFINNLTNTIENKITS